MVKFIQGDIDFDYIELPMLNEVPDDKVECAAVGQRISRPSDQIPGGIQIQLQRKGQRNGGLLGGLGIGVVDELGKMLLEDIRPLVNSGVLQALFLNKREQRFGKARVLVFSVFI